MRAAKIPPDINTTALNMPATRRWTINTVGFTKNPGMHISTAANNPPHNTALPGPQSAITRLVTSAPKK